MRCSTRGNVPFQVYNVNLCQSPVPKRIGGFIMAGTFNQYSPTFGPLGQYSVALFK
jgi:hypothetical protein